LRTRAIAVDHARASTDRGSRWLANPKVPTLNAFYRAHERLVAQAVVPRPPRRQKRPHAIWNVEELGGWLTVALDKFVCRRPEPLVQAFCRLCVGSGRTGHTSVRTVAAPTLLPRFSSCMGICHPSTRFGWTFSIQSRPCGRRRDLAATSSRDGRSRRPRHGARKMLHPL